MIEQQFMDERTKKESSQCSLEASETRMNSFYEADFASIMAQTQSSQQKAGSKGGVVTR